MQIRRHLQGRALRTRRLRRIRWAASKNAGRDCGKGYRVAGVDPQRGLNAQQRGRQVFLPA